MTAPRELYLFRHGQTDWNAEGRLQGHADVPLNAEGRAQARALAALLAPHGLEAVLSSDLSRAWETGLAVAEALGIPIQADPGLREVHTGRAQGLLAAEIETAYGRAFMDQWFGGMPSDADLTFPDGESWAAVQARAVAAIRRFCAATPHRRIGISTHGGVVRQVMALAMPPGSPPVMVPNTVVFRLTLHADGRLETTGQALAPAA
ncbi:MAG TPA: histidine phosphatase family protein [Alphaproteobacteria bacterium]|nr:histidine phosphatase family protein [Alphaproteobacteria bacterium]